MKEGGKNLLQDRIEPNSTSEKRQMFDSHVEECERAPGLQSRKDLDPWECGRDQEARRISLLIIHHNATRCQERSRDQEIKRSRDQEIKRSRG